MFGEVGLSGEVRPVQGGQERIKEAAKQGFKHAIVPKGNVAGARFAEGIKIHAISHLSELQTILNDEKILTNQR